jgi:hypothetical protein
MPTIVEIAEDGAHDPEDYDRGVSAVCHDLGLVAVPGS